MRDWYFIIIILPKRDLNKNHFVATAFFTGLVSLSAFLVFFYSLAFGTSTISSAWAWLSFLSLFMVTLAVVATVVLSSYAPPAKTVLHPLHFHIPIATLRTAV
jgi:hypothetical protein